MNILYMTRTEPSRMATGGEQRTHFIHKGLGACGTVYTVIPVFRPEDVRLDRERRVAWILVERRGSLKWWVRNVGLRICPWSALPRSGVFSPPPEWRDIHFDLAVVRHVDLAAYFVAWELAPLYLDADDLPTEWYDTLMAGSWNPTRRLWSTLIARWSQWVFRQAAHIWVARSDQLAMLPAGVSAAVLPNIPVPPPVEPSGEIGKGHYLLTVGLMSHPPNYLGLDDFLTRHWPVIRRAYPELIYKIAGGGCPERFAERWQRMDGIELLGYVEDLAPLYREALAVLTPVDRGSGTCIKVLESLRHGRVCLGSPFAFRGLPEADCVPDNGLFRCQATRDYILALDLLQDEDHRRRSQQNGLRLVQREWSPERIETILRNTLCE